MNFLLRSSVSNSGLVKSIRKPKKKKPKKWCELSKKKNYLLACSEDVNVFSEHRNILFTLHPIAVKQLFCSRKVLKFIFWALYFSAFSYTVENVLGA